MGILLIEVTSLDYVLKEANTSKSCRQLAHSLAAGVQLQSPGKTLGEWTTMTHTRLKVQSRGIPIDVNGLHLNVIQWRTVKK